MDGGVQGLRDRPAVDGRAVVISAPVAADDANSWGGDFYGKIGRSQGAKIFHVEGVDAITSRLLRAAQVNCVVNPASGPTADGTLPNDFLILLRGKGHEIHIRENQLLDD